MSETIDQRTALRLQLAMIAGNEPETSFVEIRPLDPPGRQWCVPVRKLDSAADVISKLSRQCNVFIGASPRAKRSGRAEAVERVWALWVDCDTPESVERLRAFRPRSKHREPLRLRRQRSRLVAAAPTARTRARGREQTAAWRSHSARIAAATDAARVMRPIGSLNHKTNPPRPVECVYLELGLFSVADVVCGLADDRAYAPRPTPSPQRPAATEALRWTDSAGSCASHRSASATRRSTGPHIAAASTFEQREDQRW